MSTSILNDTKHILGLLEEDTSFDSDVMLLINTQFGTLNQLGVGPVAGYQITSKDNTWDEFFTDPRLNAVKSYVFLQVKLGFDPPTIGALISAMQQQILELTYRLNVVVDYG